MSLSIQLWTPIDAETWILPWEWATLIRLLKLSLLWNKAEIPIWSKVAWTILKQGSAVAKKSKTSARSLRGSSLRWLYWRFNWSIQCRWLCWQSTETNSSWSVARCIKASRIGQTGSTQRWHALFLMKNTTRPRMLNKIWEKASWCNPCWVNRFSNSSQTAIEALLTTSGRGSTLLKGWAAEAHREGRWLVKSQRSQFCDQQTIQISSSLKKQQSTSVQQWFSTLASRTII